MSAAYDKFDPIIGGFRSRLAADLTLTDGSIGPVGVSLNASGRVVVGTGGQSGLAGILVKNVGRGPAYQWDQQVTGVPNPNSPIGAKAGDAVDILVQGHVVNLDPAAFPAGRKVYVAANGTVSVTGGAGATQIGFTVKAGQLFVNIAFNPVAAA
ncbi:minor capsid protein [Microbacterium phage Huwbert]|nr:minor capsid protein [Microbacterium phage Huwbert]